MDAKSKDIRSAFYKIFFFLRVALFPLSSLSTLFVCVKLDTLAQPSIRTLRGAGTTFAKHLHFMQLGALLQQKKNLIAQVLKYHKSHKWLGYFLYYFV